MNALTSHELSFQVPAEDGLTHQVPAAHHLIDPALLIAPHASLQQASHYRTIAANFFEPDRLQSSHPHAASFSQTQDPSNRRIFITSPHQGDGKTCTAFNLAWTLAQSEKSVLLAELNFVQPHLCAALGNPRLRFGLEGALRRKALPADAVFSIDSTSLYIAAVRNPTPFANLAPLHSNLNAFFEWANENFDLLVLDCPSVLSSEWNGWFRNHATSTLLVTRENRTPQVEIQRAIKQLGPALSGVLINATRRAPAQLSTQALPRHISPNKEVRPPSLQPNISK